MRSPRVLGSTSQISISCGSSPPMPTPNTSRPGAERRDVRDLASDEDWMAKRQEIDPDHGSQPSLVARIDVAPSEPSAPAPPVEADVVADAEAIEPGILGPLHGAPKPS